MSTIKIDKEDIVSCLSINRNQIPEALLHDIDYKVCYTYRDYNELEEHMYTEQNLIEEGMEEFVQKWEEWIKEIAKVMEENGCSYFRLIEK